MLLFISVLTFHRYRKYDFNTSHVTVYRHDRLEIFLLQEFQYISCYCLSQQES